MSTIFSGMRSLHFGRDDKNNLQQKALERFLLLVELLQEENSIIEKMLISYPEVLKQYKKEREQRIKEYLELDVKELRKKWDINNYNLTVKNYVNFTYTS
jgi:hypothetical protein